MFVSELELGFLTAYEGQLSYCVIASFQTQSRLHCVAECLATDGSLSVNTGRLPEGGFECHLNAGTRDSSTCVIEGTESFVHYE